MKKELLEQYSLEKEEEVKEFWKKKKVAEKIRAKSFKQKKKYFFMDGPPYATGNIHLGTALNKILKDIAMRYKRMKGFKVLDTPGYDTHGLPIENQVEKKLGFKTKQDIERFGVKEFVEECRSYATKYIDVQNQEFEDLGIVMDWKKPYLTLSKEYIESIWWTFKKAHEKGLLYLGIYPVHVCPHCETAVAYNEIEYTKLTDTSVFVKFKVKGRENTFLIIWTTTPWTLPGNTGVMVNPNYEYAEIEMSNGETWIIAKERIEQLTKAIEAGYTVKKTVKGKELEGIEYETPLQEFLEIQWEKIPNKENKYRVILSERYVNLEEGTGLVHAAPGHGREDFDAGSKAKLPAISPVEMNGEMKKETGKYKGKKAREVDTEIISDLEEKNSLIYQHPYTHDYAICWRCKTPLLMISTPQWFFKISGIQKRLKELNEEVFWTPNWMKDRMKNWLDSLGDWPVSRKRYWGTPLPIWLCECGEKKVIGSVKELKKYASVSENIDLHKPEIDEIKWKCEKCGKEMNRVEEVMDVWLDSGVTSWAVLGGAESTEFKKYWPADLNIEGTEQVRGWWNSQLITSTICFDKKPFKAIEVHGMVLGMGKKKMSKSLGNIVQPKETVQKYNREFLRYYLTLNSKGEDLAFDLKEFQDIGRTFNTLWNTYNYASMYLNLKFSGKTKLEAEDRWILSKLNSLLGEAEKNYEENTPYKVLQLAENFLLEEVSRTYIKIVRDRVGTKSQKGVEYALGKVMLSLLQILSPIVPHFTEYLYQDLKKGKMPESIHLTEFPKTGKKAIDKELEKEFEKFKELKENALHLREQEKLRLRWPLKELIVKSKTGKEFKKLQKLVAKTLNVKKFTETKKEPKGKYAVKEFSGIKLYLNTEADSKLKEEWEFQELRRRVQELRKKAKLLPQKKTVLLIEASDEKFLKKYGKQLERETNTKLKKGKGEMEKVLDREFYLELKK